MGLLLSSPGVHESWTPLSSWLVSSKSKGGFGTSVEQTHTHTQVVNCHFKRQFHSLSVMLCTEGHFRDTSLLLVCEHAMEMKETQLRLLRTLHTQANPSRSSVYLLFKTHKITACQIHWGRARVLGTLSVCPLVSRKEHQQNTREAEQSRLRDKCRWVTCAVQRIVSVPRLGGNSIWRLLRMVFKGRELSKCTGSVPLRQLLEPRLPRSRAAC